MSPTNRPRRVAWELLPTTIFGAFGLCLVLTGAWAFVGVLLLTTVWKPVIFRLEVSYLLLVTAGLCLCFSAHFTRRRDWRSLSIAAAAGMLFCGIFYVINPGAIPLR